LKTQVFKLSYLPRGKPRGILSIEVSIFIVRAFIKLREMINTHQMLKKKIIEIEARLSGHDEQLTQMVQLLKQMLDPKPPATKRRIGF